MPASQHIFSRYDKMTVKVQDLNVTGTLTAAGSDITAALAEVAALDGLTASSTELNFNDTAVAGTAVASKTLVLGADKNIDTISIAASGLKIGAGAGTAVTKTAAELNLLAVGVAAGYKVARVEQALDGGNPTSWATGLTTIIAAAVTLKGTAAPGVGTCLVTSNINGTSLDVYAWKPTAANDCTLIASTGVETFYGIAIGT